MLDPESMSPGSIMPPYPWLMEDNLNLAHTARKIKVLRQLGTPYPKAYETNPFDHMKKQALEITERLKKDGIEQAALEDKEIIALIAYLQRLGTDIKPKIQAAE